MRLAVISDIHGNLTALDAVLKDMEAQGGIDMVWCLGDLAAFGPHPSECIEKVFDLQTQYGEENVKIIGGNTDRYLVTGERMPAKPIEDADQLQGFADNLHMRDQILNWNLAQISFEDYERLAKILHREISLKVEGYGKVIGYHAIPGDDEGWSLLPDSSEEEARDALLDREGILAIGGHTHIQMDRDLGNWRVINPGSIGMSTSNPGKAEWALLDFSDGAVNVQLRALEYDHAALIADLNMTEHPHPIWVTGKLTN